MRRAEPLVSLTAEGHYGVTGNGSEGAIAMVSGRYWDVTGCCWKPCSAGDGAASRSSSYDADMAVLGGTTPAALPTSTGPAATSADPAPPEVADPAEG